MSKLALNFAVPPRRLNAWHPAWGMALLLIGCSTLGYAIWHYQQQLAQRSQLQAQRNELRSHTQPSSAPIATDLLPQIGQANATYALVRAPWSDVFEAVEAARNKASHGIALLSVKASGDKRELNLSGEAKDFAALHAFTEALSEQAVFTSVTLSNDKLSTGTLPIVITFDLRLTWRAEAHAAH